MSTKKNLSITSKQIELITKTAVQTALEYIDKEKEKRKKAKHDRLRHNIRALLRNYRNFEKYVEGVQLELNEINRLIGELYDEDFTLESIKRSKQRTYALVKFMERMLNVYKIMCEQSDKPEEKRRYQVIYLMYLADKKSTAEEISMRLFIDRSTVFRDINEACEDLSVLMFGVDAIRVE